jgi:hypothetical protein
MKWSDHDTAVLKLFIRRMREEGWTKKKLIEEAVKFFPERSAISIKQKVALIIKRRQV